MAGSIREGGTLSSYSPDDPLAPMLPFVSGDDPVVVVTPEVGQLDFIDADALSGGGVGITVEMSDASSEVAGDGLRESIDDELVQERDIY
jgi:hypothetical protein